MQRRAVVASPVLVGRDELLALADRRLEETAAGRGGLLFVAGEAGIGKTRLLASVGRRAHRSGFTVLRAAAFPGDAVASGGVLLDLASDLRRAADPSLREVGTAISRRLREPMSEDEDRHRRRRLLVQDLADALADLDSGQRLAVVLEDLHWADQLSLEVIGHLASRLETRATLVLGAYRTDELFERTPMRQWRGRLLGQRLAEEVRLPRLTLAETAVLASTVVGGAVGSRVVAAIHDRSDGIPLHVEELLAATEDVAAVADVDGVLDLRVPDTLADAVLARAEALDEVAKDLASAAAVIGRSFDFDLLTLVTEQEPETVDRCLRLLQHLHLVHAGAGPVTFDFRHALIRDAMYADVPLPLRRRLHERVAVVAADRGYPDAFVSAHFDRAGLAAPAYRHALAAAREAAALSAHREAIQLYRRAQRNLPSTIAAHDHAVLLAAVGDEATAVDENGEALDAYTAAHGLWTEAGDRLAAAAVVPRLVAVAHLLGEDLDRRVGRLQDALATVDGTVGADRVRAQLLSGLAAAYMLDRRLDEGITFGEQSRALSRAVGDLQAELDTAATLGSVLVFAGRMDDGWALLEDAVTRAVRGQREAAAARAYRMIGTSASVLVEYDRADAWLVPGLAYAEAVELWNHRSYLAGHLAHVQWATGRWAEAEQTARRALADGRGGITTRITAHYVLGYLALGRGDWNTAQAMLAEALREGESMRELQRISPPLWGLAEAALLRGDHDTAVALCDRGYALSAEVADAAYLFPFLLTGVRARLARQEQDAAERWLATVEAALAHRSIPGTLPAVEHARGLLQLAGGEHDAARASLQAAREAWGRRRRFWEGSWATLDAARAAFAARRLAEAAALANEARELGREAGATPMVEAADELLLRNRRGRPAQPWHPLTEREFGVAALVADGLTNRQIAERLFLSPKTVSAHVEHILTKLGAGRRTEIAAWVARIDA